jgi:hypothetical protein
MENDISMGIVNKRGGVGWVQVITSWALWGIMFVLDFSFGWNRWYP